MSLPIAPINLATPSILAPAAGVAPAAATSPVAGSAFHEMFSKAVNTVESFQTKADTAVQNLLSGASEDVHTPIIATQQADLSFELFMQVRNKVVSAYQTVMNMQV